MSNDVRSQRHRPPFVPPHLHRWGPVERDNGLNRHPLSDPVRRAQAIEQTRSELTTRDEIGLALRMDRGSAGESQRAYAQRRGISRDLVRRVEADDAGRLTLEAAGELLEGTGYVLTVVRAGTEVEKPSDAIDPERLVARDLAGRTLPAHLAISVQRFPSMSWYLRSGGWLTKQVAPAWTYTYDRWASTSRDREP